MKKIIIKAENGYTKETRHFTSIKQCADFIGCSVSLVNVVLSRLQRNAYHKTAKGWLLSYE